MGFFSKFKYPAIPKDKKDVDLPWLINYKVNPIKDNPLLTDARRIYSDMNNHVFWDSDKCLEASEKWNKIAPGTRKMFLVLCLEKNLVVGRQKTEAKQLFRI